MKVCKEVSLSEFEFWSGAKDNANMLTSEELDELEPYVVDLLGTEETPTETAVNDLFWFDFATVISYIGLKLDGNGNIDRGEDEDEDEDN